MTNEEEKEDRFLVDKLEGDESFVKAREQVKNNCERLRKEEQEKR